jgi:flagellar protein FlbB
MAGKILTIGLLIIALLVAAVFAANAAGVIDLRSTAAEIPVLNSLIGTTAGNEEEIPVSPIEEENKRLLKQIAELEKKITELEGEKTKALEQVALSQQELTELRAYKTEKENIVISATEIAAYYKEMKPEAVVKIMNTLDDDTVITILPLLEKDQSGDILALMDPQRAALITQMLMGTSPEG